MEPSQILGLVVTIVITAALNGVLVAYVATRVIQAELRGLRGRIAAAEKRLDRLEGPLFAPRPPG